MSWRTNIQIWMSSHFQTLQRRIRRASAFRIWNVATARQAEVIRSESSWWLSRRLDAERERLFLWVPVAFGFGIGAYFALPHEPSVMITAVIAIVCLTLRHVFRMGVVVPALTGVLVWAALGLNAGKLRTEFTRAPVLDTPVDARMVAGFVEGLDRRAHKGTRITLRVRALQDVPADVRPERIRFTWSGATDIRVGDTISVRVNLKPPPIPVRPGGYDYARRAWFQQIGAVGFAVSPPLRSVQLPAPPSFIGARSWMSDLRGEIAQRVERAVPGDAGAIINALIIGERGRVPEEKLDHLRRSGLAHMLAISGLHMAMIAGALFWLLRGVLAVTPRFALNHEIKKWAAIAALMGGVIYLAVSGASVATQRAAIMIGLMLVAVLLDRPAISLRNVALAALCILALAPENILEIGFQMSFAAVVALVSFYEWWQARQAAREVVRGGMVRNPIFAAAIKASQGLVVGTFVTTLIAGLAVAPFGAFHFHRVSQLSLLANVLAMPVFTLVVMPMALVTLLTLPFGLETSGLSVMAWGIEQVTGVAAWVSGQPNAVRPTATMSNAAFLAMVAGGLWLCLWRERWRWLGLLPLCFGLAIATHGTSPDVLIGREGKLIAVKMDGDAYAVSPGRLGAFELSRWLAADGDPRVAEDIERGRGFVCDDSGCNARTRGLLIAMPRTPASLADDCAVADIVVLKVQQVQPCPSAKLVVDRPMLERDGVHAIRIAGSGGVHVNTVEASRGARPWTRRGRQISKVPRDLPPHAQRKTAPHRSVAPSRKSDR